MKICHLYILKAISDEIAHPIAVIFLILSLYFAGHLILDVCPETGGWLTSQQYIKR